MARPRGSRGGGRRDATYRAAYEKCILPDQRQFDSPDELDHIIETQLQHKNFQLVAGPGLEERYRTVVRRIRETWTSNYGLTFGAQQLLLEAVPGGQAPDRDALTDAQIKQDPRDLAIIVRPVEQIAAASRLVPKPVEQAKPVTRRYQWPGTTTTRNDQWYKDQPDRDLEAKSSEDETGPRPPVRISQEELAPHRSERTSRQACSKLRTGMVVEPNGSPQPKDPNWRQTFPSHHPDGIGVADSIPSQSATAVAAETIRRKLFRQPQSPPGSPKQDLLEELNLALDRITNPRYRRLVRKTKDYLHRDSSVVLEHIRGLAERHGGVVGALDWLGRTQFRDLADLAGPRVQIKVNGKRGMDHASDLQPGLELRIEADAVRSVIDQPRLAGGQRAAKAGTREEPIVLEDDIPRAPKRRTNADSASQPFDPDNNFVQPRKKRVAERMQSRMSHSVAPATYPRVLRSGSPLL